MKRGFYRKLAWTGIRKNKKLYTPYILTCIGMVMMYYIVSFLSLSDMLKGMPGGVTVQSLLNLGTGVIAVFSVIFLFYTNSFLIRRRKKEFGLYNILGMGKWNLARVLLWETLMIAVISLAVGLTAGIALSKLAELGMVNILAGDVTFSFSVSIQSIGSALILFAVIFGLIFINTLRQIHLSNPIELLHSENAGEKPPKANWFFALAGAVILAAAYYLAVTIEDPVTAMIWFFVAVVMVIVATYLLFIAGSVAFCRLLQKNKRYYYKTNHFVSVSSMVYRMKRNGAGLASICVLCTMVLVMVSSTVCLYSGAEDSIRSRYPRNIVMDTVIGSISDLGGEKEKAVRAAADEAASQNGAEPSNIQDYEVLMFEGYIQGDQLHSGDNNFDVAGLSNLWQIFVISVDDYNRLMGQNETLSPGEVLIHTTKMKNYEKDTISINDAQPLTVKKTVPDFVDTAIDTAQIIPTMYIFVPDLAEAAQPMLALSDEDGDPVAYLHWYYGFDLDCEEDVQIQVLNQIQTRLEGLSLSDDQSAFITSCEGAASERDSFYAMYGGLFFLGILLGIVFVFAAVLIMYYKQISEGYEDQSRFDIMQKVGMTKREIKKSINSQILTVFFLPLLMAGVHLAFAFPLISKLLALFALTNTTLLVLVTLGCFLVFALFYVLVYRITSRAYYSIVSGAKEDA